MGNVDSRSHSSRGYIFLQTHQQTYYPQENVTGTLYMRITEMFEGSNIEIEVKGKEKAKWVEHHTRTERDGDETRTVHETIKRKKDRTIYHFKGPCFTFSAPCAEGDYQIPFAFTLPDGLPSSLHFQPHHHKANIKASVKYTIRAIVNPHHGDKMKYKQVLIVRERPFIAEGDIEKTDHANLKTWCCVDQGHSSIKTRFEKNTFYPNEHANCLVELDNSTCDLRMTGVTIAVEQRISLKADGHSLTDTFTLNSEHADGADARQAEKLVRNLSLDLKEIKYEMPKEKKKRGVMKPVSMEDQFMGS